MYKEFVEKIVGLDSVKFLEENNLKLNILSDDAFWKSIYEMINEFKKTNGFYPNCITDEYKPPMKQIFLECDDEDFLATFEYDDYYSSGTIYPIFKNEDGTFEYLSTDGNGASFKDLNDECKILFTYRYTWRGVWDGRIYFPNDEEYYPDDLEMMLNLWNQLESTLKDEIRKRNKHCHE